MAAGRAIEPARHILVVDDDNRLRRLLQRYLAEHGYHVTAAADADEAKAALRNFAFDLVVLDVMLPGQSGISLTSASNLKLTAKANVSIEAGANLSLKAKANASLEGLQVAHKAKAKFAANGAASAELTSSGMLTVRGTLVKIN